MSLAALEKDDVEHRWCKPSKWGSKKDGIIHELNLTILNYQVYPKIFCVVAKSDWNHCFCWTGFGYFSGYVLPFYWSCLNVFFAKKIPESKTIGRQTTLQSHGLQKKVQWNYWRVRIFKVFFGGGLTRNLKKLRIEIVTMKLVGWVEQKKGSGKKKQVNFNHFEMSRIASLENIPGHN